MGHHKIRRTVGKRPKGVWYPLRPRLGFEHATEHCQRLDIPEPAIVSQQGLQQLPPKWMSSPGCFQIWVRFRTKAKICSYRSQRPNLDKILSSNKQGRSGILLTRFLNIIHIQYVQFSQRFVNRQEARNILDDDFPSSLDLSIARVRSLTLTFPSP